MLSQLRQHHDSQISRPVPWATQHSLPLLLTAMSFLSLPAVAFSQLDPRFQPDGAPGENLAPGAAGERFAQAATEEADNAAEAADDITPLDKDDAPRLQRNLDNIDFRAPVIRSKQAVWHKIERAVQGRDWGEVLQRIDRFIGPVDNSESEDYVIRHEDGSLRSARLSTARLLGSLPKNRRVARARGRDYSGKHAVPTGRSGKQSAATEQRRCSILWIAPSGIWPPINWPPSSSTEENLPWPPVG